MPKTIVLNVPEPAYAAAVGEALETLEAPPNHRLGHGRRRGDERRRPADQALDDGSPCYVVNYDDFSGRSDLAASGRGNGKTIYI